MNFTIQRIIGIFKNLGQKHMLIDFINFKRKNRYKGQKTPVEILKESGSNILVSI
jgi:hypothetical protein